MEGYDVIGPIGKGSFGLVQKIKRKSDGKVLVWKEMNFGKMTEREKQQLVAEVNIIRELNHPNIVRYYDRIIDKKETKIFIIMEYCECGDLGTLLKKCKKEKDYIAEDIIWKIFTQILLALNECHSRTAGKILHRDLKPANLFLDAQNNIKLGDFGLSRVMGENSVFATTHVGTPYYMSPEQIQEAKYNETSDIWSAGCLLYEMAALKPPFEATNHLSLAIKIKAGKFERLPLRYSEELQQLVERMIHIDPKKRPLVGQLMELPQVSLRLKERRLRDTHAGIKQKEDAQKKREEQIQKMTDTADEKERLIQSQEKLLLDLKDEIRRLEMNIDNQSTLNRDSGIFQSSQLLRNSRVGEYQLVSSTLNSFGKDLPLSNRTSGIATNFKGNDCVPSNSSMKSSQSLSMSGTINILKMDKENVVQNNNIQTQSTLGAYKKEKEIQRSLTGTSSQLTRDYNQNNDSQDPPKLSAHQSLKIMSNYEDITQRSTKNSSTTSSIVIVKKEGELESSKKLQSQLESTDQFVSIAPKSEHNTSGSAYGQSSSKKEDNLANNSATVKVGSVSVKQDKSTEKQFENPINKKSELLEETGFDKYKARLLSERATATRERILSTEGIENPKSEGIKQEIFSYNNKQRTNGSIEESRNVSEHKYYLLNKREQIGKGSLETGQSDSSSIIATRQIKSAMESKQTPNYIDQKSKQQEFSSKIEQSRCLDSQKDTLKNQQQTQNSSGLNIQTNTSPIPFSKIQSRQHGLKSTLQQQVSSYNSKPPKQQFSINEETTKYYSNSEVFQEEQGGNRYLTKKKSTTDNSFGAVPTYQSYLHTTINYLSNPSNEYCRSTKYTEPRCTADSSQERKQELPFRNQGGIKNQQVPSKTIGSVSEKFKGYLAETISQDKNNYQSTQKAYSRVLGSVPVQNSQDCGNEKTTIGSAGARIIERNKIQRTSPSPTPIQPYSQYKSTTINY